MSTEGEILLEKALNLKDGEKLSIDAKFRHKRDSLKSSFYKAKAAQGIDNIYLSQKGNSLIISRNKKERLSVEVLKISENVITTITLTPEEKEQQEKEESVTIFLKEKEEILNNPALSKLEKEELIFDASIKRNEIYEFYNKKHREKMQLDKASGKRPRIILDDSDTNEIDLSSDKSNICIEKE
jgi:hypothetical protein